MSVVLVVVALTSLAVLVLVARRGVGGAAQAIGTTLEVVGAAVIFFAVNLALGVTLILAARRLALFYATLYEVADIALLVVSLVEALTVTAWMGGRRR